MNHTPPPATMNHKHIAVWLDHREARVFHVTLDSADEKHVLAPKHHLRRSEVTHEPKLEAQEHKFFRELIDAIGDAQEVLVVGPGLAKTEFVHYVRDKAPALAPCIVGVETVDHPTDGQFVALARKHFRAIDRRLGDG